MYTGGPEKSGCLDRKEKENQEKKKNSGIRLLLGEARFLASSVPEPRGISTGLLVIF